MSRLQLHRRIIWRTFITSVAPKSTAVIRSHQNVLGKMVGRGSVGDCDNEDQSRPGESDFRDLFAGSNPQEEFRVAEGAEDDDLILEQIINALINFDQFNAETSGPSEEENMEGLDLGIAGEGLSDTDFLESDGPLSVTGTETEYLSSVAEESHVDKLGLDVPENVMGSLGLVQEDTQNDSLEESQNVTLIHPQNSDSTREMPGHILSSEVEQSLEIGRGPEGPPDISNNVSSDNGEPSESSLTDGFPSTEEEIELDLFGRFSRDTGGETEMEMDVFAGLDQLTSDTEKDDESDETIKTVPRIHNNESEHSEAHSSGILSANVTAKRGHDTRTRRNTEDNTLIADDLNECRERVVRSESLSERDGESLEREGRSVERESASRDSSCKRESLPKDSLHGEETFERDSSHDRETSERDSSHERETFERDSSHERETFERDSSHEREAFERDSSYKREILERDSSHERENFERDSSEREIVQIDSSERESFQRDSSERETLERESSDTKTLHRENSDRETLQRENSENEMVQRDSSENEMVQRDSSEREIVQRDSSSEVESTQIESTERDNSNDRSSFQRDETENSNDRIGSQRDERSNERESPELEESLMEIENAETESSIGGAQERHKFSCNEERDEEEVFERRESPEPGRIETSKESFTGVQQNKMNAKSSGKPNCPDDNRERMEEEKCDSAQGSSESLRGKKRKLFSDGKKVNEPKSTKRQFIERRIELENEEGEIIIKQDVEGGSSPSEDLNQPEVIDLDSSESIADEKEEEIQFLSEINSTNSKAGERPGDGHWEFTRRKSRRRCIRKKRPREKTVSESSSDLEVFSRESRKRKLSRTGSKDILREIGKRGIPSALVGREITTEIGGEKNQAKSASTNVQKESAGRAISKANSKNIPTEYKSRFIPGNISGRENLNQSVSGEISKESEVTKSSAGSAGGEILQETEVTKSSAGSTSGETSRESSRRGNQGERAGEEIPGSCTKGNLQKEVGRRLSPRRTNKGEIPRETVTSEIPRKTVTSEIPRKTPRSEISRKTQTREIPKQNDNGDIPRKNIEGKIPKRSPRETPTKYVDKSSELTGASKIPREKANKNCPTVSAPTDFLKETARRESSKENSRSKITRDNASTKSPREATRKENPKESARRDIPEENTRGGSPIKNARGQSPRESARIVTPSLCGGKSRYGDNLGSNSPTEIGRRDITSENVNKKDPRQSSSKNSSKNKPIESASKNDPRNEKNSKESVSKNDPRNEKNSKESVSKSDPRNEKNSKESVSKSDPRNEKNSKESVSKSDPKDNSSEEDPKESASKKYPMESASKTDPKESFSKKYPKERFSKNYSKDSSSKKSSNESANKNHPKESANKKDPEASASKKDPKANDSTNYSREIVSKIDPRVIVSKINPRVIVNKIDPRVIVNKIDPTLIVSKINPRVIVSKINPRVIVNKIDPTLFVSKINPRVSVNKIDPRVIVTKINPRVIGNKIDPREIFSKKDPREILSKNDPRKSTSKIGPGISSTKENTRESASEKNTRESASEENTRETVSEEISRENPRSESPRKSITKEIPRNTDTRESSRESVGQPPEKKIPSTLPSERGPICKFRKATGSILTKVEKPSKYKIPLKRIRRRVTPRKWRKQRYKAPSETESEGEDFQKRNKRLEIPILKLARTMMTTTDMDQTSSEEPPETDSDWKGESGAETISDEAMDSKTEREEDGTDTESAFPCKVCGKVFPERNHLAVHNFRTHKEFYKNSRPKPLFRPVQRLCIVCSKTFTSISNLKKHLRTHKPANKPFHCDQCPRVTRTADQLEIHKRKIHEKPARTNDCPICPHQGRSRNDLDVHHIIAHIPEEEYKHPTEQGAWTSDDEALEKQGVSKKREIPKKTPKKTQPPKIKKVKYCDQCGRGFKIWASLKRHCRLKHKSAAVCYCCLRSFPTKEDYDEHLRELPEPLSCPQKHCYRNLPSECLRDHHVMLVHAEEEEEAKEKGEESRKPFSLGLGQKDKGGKGAEQDDKGHKGAEQDDKGHKGVEQDDKGHKGAGREGKIYRGAEPDKKGDKGVELGKKANKGAEPEREIYKGAELAKKANKGAEPKKKGNKGAVQEEKVSKGADLGKKGKLGKKQAKLKQKWEASCTKDEIEEKVELKDKKGEELEEADIKEESKDKGREEPKKFPCLVCPRVFHEKSHLQKHESVLHKNGPWLCRDCRKSFRAKSYLIQHQAVHAGGRPFKCELCSRSYKTQHHLSIHRKTHNKEKLWKCGECAGKAFVNQRGLRKHQANVHGTMEKPHQCPYCTKRYFDRAELLRERIPGGCWYCKLKSKFQEITRHSAARPFSCEKCGNGYITKGAMAHHFKMKHTMNPPVRKPRPKPVYAENPPKERKKRKKQRKKIFTVPRNSIDSSGSRSPDAPTI